MKGLSLDSCLLKGVFGFFGGDNSMVGAVVMMAGAVGWIVGRSGTGGRSSCAACILAVAASWVSEKCLHLNILKRRVAGVAS